MPLIGNYDPATYVAGTFATYPPLPAGVTLYQPSMWWNSTGTGVMDGQQVVPNDRIYAYGKGRLYGEFRYGEEVFGGPTGSDWPASRVTWIVWSDAGLPPNWVDPYPFTGCPLGDYAPGWNIVVDSFFNDLSGSRTYGEFLYGDEVFGDTTGSDPAWHDLTRESFAVNITAGTADGRDVVPVTEMIVDLWDDDASVVDISPVRWHTARLGSAIRVGVFDPGWHYYPLATGEIRAIEDIHDNLPRYVTITAFGVDTKLAAAAGSWQRPAELLSTRLKALLAAARYPVADVETYPRDSPLTADTQQRMINIRAELDRTAASGGMQFDTTPRADLRLRDWPLAPTGAPLHVVDCPTSGAVMSGEIGFTADDDELLNEVWATNNTDPPTVVYGAHQYSLSVYGPFSGAMGFPRTDLAFADQANAAQWCQRVANRFGLCISRANDIVADTDVDPTWLPHLATLDTGQAVTVERTELEPFTLDGVVTGYQHRLIRNRWQATLHTDTITPSA